MISEEEEFLQDLRAYYRFLFPHKALTQWLSYSNTPRSSQLHKREFSYTMLQDGQEIYVRYQIVRDDADLLSQLTRESQTPAKIDIGAFFEQEPVKGRPNKPTAKELVIDIDINDYDQVRTCCQGKKCCAKCWQFMAVAITILIDSFKLDFGFSNFLVVFSGRRGVHLWVCDEKALGLQVGQRRAVISYLKLIAGNETVNSLLCENTLREERV
jgi:DNA primase small subunit